MQIFSWNINGLRSAIKKGALDAFLQETKPDIICLQEIKMKPDQATLDLPDYQEFWHSAERPGYSGTAIFTKVPPLNVSNGFDEQICSAYDWQNDQYGTPLNEGRVMTAEFNDFFLVNVYTPNSKRDLTRLSLRKNFWDPAFLEYIQTLETRKPVVVCGDFNAAHTPLDLARPKDNEKNAGFTEEERQGIENIIGAGFTDTFRHFHPSAERYTWWSHIAKSRERNIGWRIDYFFVSQSLLPRLQSAEIYEHIQGSDHCPISITLED